MGLRRVPHSIVNLKSNTMKNTHANIYTFLLSANLKKR